MVFPAKGDEGQLVADGALCLVPIEMDEQGLVFPIRHVETGEVAVTRSGIAQGPQRIGAYIMQSEIGGAAEKASRQARLGAG